MSNVKNIRKYGTYYNPAWLHYENENVSVRCCACGKQNLEKCIGFGRLDLCLPCADGTVTEKRPFSFPDTQPRKKKKIAFRFGPTSVPVVDSEPPKEPTNECTPGAKQRASGGHAF